MKKTINELIKQLKEEASEYASGWFFEDASCMKDIEHKIIQKNLSLSEHRWYIRKQNVLKIGEKYIAITWNDPATEQQEGQETNINIYEVKPIEKTVVEFIAI